MNTCVVEDCELPVRSRVIVAQTATHYMDDVFPGHRKFDIDRYLPPPNDHLMPKLEDNGRVHSDGAHIGPYFRVVRGDGVHLRPTGLGIMRSSAAVPLDCDLILSN